MSKAKKIIICFLGACLVACSGLTAFATHTIYVDMSKPQTSDTLSYIELYLTNPSSGLYMGVCGIFIINTDPSFDVKVRLIDDYTIEIRSANMLFGYWADLVWKSWNNMPGSGSLNGNGLSIMTLSFNVNMFRISAVRTFGSLRNDTGMTTGDYNICYGEDKIFAEKLDSIISLLEQQNANTNKITSNADKNANNIQSNDDKNTQAVIENQQQIQENEKNEAETQGQGSVDDISGAIEDKSAGFISSITSLVSSMSYEGTSCAWSFPALKLPAIAGVMPEYQLTEEKPIDFEFWVNKIPSNILLLVRSLLTIGLIVYCFKELYSTISYVLTLKGGGNNE